MTQELLEIECPKCGEAMASMCAIGCARTGQLWKCTSCVGMWLDQTACEILLDEDQTDDVRAFIRGSQAGKALPTHSALPTRSAGAYRASARPGDGVVRCAECGQELIAYETSEARLGVRLRLDVCRGHGTWFDRGEAAQFLMVVELRRYGSHGRLPEQGVQPWPDDRPEPKAPIPADDFLGPLLPEQGVQPWPDDRPEPKAHFWSEMIDLLEFIYKYEC